MANIFQSNQVLQQVNVGAKWLTFFLICFTQITWSRWGTDTEHVYDLIFFFYFHQYLLYLHFFFPSGKLEALYFKFLMVNFVFLTSMLN